MTRLRNAACIALLTAVLFAPVPAAVGQDQAAAPPAEPSKRDAPVLCVWTLLLATQLVGEKCHAGEDPAFQAELASSIHRVDGFISANDATATPDKIEAFKKQFRDQSAGQDICSEQGAQALYADAKAAGADRIRSDTDELIAVPRKPTKDGC